ncbi:unnamed protein product, partial [Linum tenue]
MLIVGGKSERKPLEKQCKHRFGFHHCKVLADADSWTHSKGEESIGVSCSHG